jgi:hypothetical protein
MRRLAQQLGPFKVTFLVLKVTKEFKEFKVSKESKEYKVSKVSKVFPAYKVYTGWGPMRMKQLNTP